MATKNIRGSQNCITQTTAISLPFFSSFFLFSLFYTSYLYDSYDFLTIYFIFTPTFIDSLRNSLYFATCTHWLPIHVCLRVYVWVCTTCVQDQRIVDVYSFLFLHVKLTLRISSSTGKYTSILFLLLGLYLVSSLL